MSSVIRQLKNWFTKQNIYPQTVEQAIYDSYGRRLDNKLSSGVANPNLLINTDFSNPVNQRGYVNGTSMVHNYSIDRWIMLGSLIMNDDYVTLNSYLGDNRGLNYLGYLVQRVEFPNRFRNKTVTLSVKYRTINDDCNLGLFTTRDDTSRVFFSHLPNTGGEWKIHSITIECEDIDYTQFEYCIYTGYIYDIHDKWTNNVFVNTQKETSIDIVWAKLEDGDIATPFRPRLYAEELLLCQRYFRSTVLSLVHAVNDDCAVAVDSRLFPVPMRTIPSVNLCSGNGTANKFADLGGGDSAFSVVSPWSVSDTYIQGFWITNGYQSTINGYQYGYLAYVKFDAEL